MIEDSAAYAGAAGAATIIAARARESVTQAIPAAAMQN
jgi:hypothetical protein